MPQQGQQGQQGSGSIVVAPQSATGLPANFDLLKFDGFSTLNTKPTRPGIADQEMFWCDNFMPLGAYNLRCLPDKGTAIYTAPTNKTIAQFQFGNIGAVSVAMVFLSDGSIVQVNLATGATTSVAPAGTIATPTDISPAMSQWGSQYLLIVAPQANGYFVWDGTALYSAGTLGPSVMISNGGLDYTSTPMMTAFGGSGSGATFTATIENGSIATISVTNAGSGYGSTDVVGIAFSGGGSTNTATATAVISGGAVTSVTGVLGGSGYTATATATFLGGGGVGATGTVSVSGGAVTSVNVSDGGQGYNAAPTIIIQDTGNTVAVATVTVMPFGVKGNAIETFTSRVWIADGSKILFSAASSVSDFGTPDGGGAFTSTDSFLRDSFTALRQSNGFLYLIGDSSVNYISGVNTTGSPPTTTFTNLNVDPQTGTPWPETVEVYSRAIVFANSFGVHIMYGGAVQKISAQLDGFYASVDPSTFGSFSPHSAIATVFGIRVYCLLLPIIDQITGVQRKALLMWDGTRWWTGSQSVALNQINSVEINSVLTAYGSDGTNLYPLFATGSTALTKTVRSKMWDTPSYIALKHAIRVYGLFEPQSGDVGSGTITVESEIQSQSIPLTSLFTMTWLNSSNQPIAWVNDANEAIQWLSNAPSIPGVACDVAGSLLGLTLVSTAADMTVVGLSLVVQSPYRWNL